MLEMIHLTPGGSFCPPVFKMSEMIEIIKIIEIIDLTPLVFQMIDILIAVVVPGYTS